MIIFAGIFYYLMLGISAGAAVHAAIRMMKRGNHEGAGWAIITVLWICGAITNSLLK